MATAAKAGASEALISAAEVGEWLGYSADTVRRYARTERLPYRKMAGRKMKFLRSEVQAWLDSRKEVAHAPAGVPEPARVSAKGGGDAPASGGGWASIRAGLKGAKP